MTVRSGEPTNNDVRVRRVEFIGITVLEQVEGLMDFDTC
jgi:hypothetical protein